MVDAHANFAISTVATAPSPASSGTSLIVQAGDGSLFPATPFNATVGPAGVILTKLNSEIIRVTALSTDTFGTIIRAQEGTNARTIIVGDQVFVSITAKTLTDAEALAYAAISTVSSSVTLSAANPEVVALIASGGAPTLPTAVGNTTQYRIKNIDTTNKSIATTSSQTIDGSAGPITIIPNQSLDIVSDGTNWRIL